ncbi:unknown [Candidatus Apopatosoma intestinale]|jgi:predicted TIM-barrel fold metal-dependent hydrolase|nr:unknown [Candidatus Apopatosoma intestinale]
MAEKKPIKRILSALLLSAMLCTCLFAVGDSAPKTLNFAIVADSTAIKGCASGVSVLDSYFAMARKYSVRPVIFIKADGLEYGPDLVFALSKLKVQGYEIYPAAENPEAAYKFRDFMRHVAKHGVPFVLTKNADAEFENFGKIYYKTTVRFYEELISSVYSGEKGCTALLLSGESLYAAELMLTNSKASGTVPADIYALVKLNAQE